MVPIEHRKVLGHFGLYLELKGLIAYEDEFGAFRVHRDPREAIESRGDVG